MTSSDRPRLASQAAKGSKIKARYISEKGENKATKTNDRASISRMSKTIKNCFRWNNNLKKALRGNKIMKEDNERNIKLLR